MSGNLKFESNDLSDTEVQLKGFGDVTIHTSSRLREQLKPFFTARMQSIHVALDEVSFMDSSGIATLVEGMQWSRLTGGRFVLSGLQDNVRDVFSLAKLDTIFEIEDSTNG